MVTFFPELEENLPKEAEVFFREERVGVLDRQPTKGSTRSR
jgi:hypothetical protein